MANISVWEKLRKKATGSYSEKLTLELALEKAELDAQRKEARERILAQQAAAKAAEEAYAKAKAEKAAAAKVEEVKAAAKPQAKKVVKDGDGDGFINDGTKNQKPAPKATAKKQAELKAKPKATPKPAAPVAKTSEKKATPKKK